MAHINAGKTKTPQNIAPPFIFRKDFPPWGINIFIAFVFWVGTPRGMTKTAMITLAATLAAMPVDQPLSAAFGWVVDLGAGAVAR